MPVLSFLAEDTMQALETQAAILGIQENDIREIRIEKECRIRMIFPAETRQLELIRRLAHSTASQAPGLDPQTADDISLALDEACTNIMAHAYDRHSHQKIIEVELSISSDSITIILTDQGESGRCFEPEKLRPPDMDALRVTPIPGGLGFHLIRKIMDAVTYEKGPGQPNRLTMKRYIHRPG
ncbi:ATP-binding protein [Desulfobotulus sp. H1]|uniref:ATP-binding protein n=1 Tax=Desulfobotulus pelophilus TaxID=2823377 RepID=A0ABT3N7Z8_9BACT|nr:ATP-binding protein [Desulfobotulus pelophilus]MCW7753577.1 ATP-binding protein [Desulfobotulus pelophilus]